MENNNGNNSGTVRDKSWETFVAAGLGALIAGFADWSSNKADSIVAEMTRMLPFLGNEVTGLILIGVLGVAVCWVFRPATRIDGFARGLAILALIGIPTENNQADSPQETGALTTSIQESESDRLLASLSTYSSGDFQNVCPTDTEAFEPNATIISNEWVSATKPETKWYSSKIFVDKCGEALEAGQRVQKLESFETYWKGYYYVKVRFQQNGATRVGWIYCGRNPNYWQQIRPDEGVKP